MNKIVLTGNVGRIEYREGVRKSNGKSFPICAFSIAVDNRFNDTTMWVNCSCMNPGLIEKVLKPYVQKGHKLLIEGRLSIRPYVNSQGQTLSYTEVIVDSLEMLTPRNQTITTNTDSPNITNGDEIFDPATAFDPSDFTAISDADIPF